MKKSRRNLNTSALSPEDREHVLKLDREATQKAQVKTYENMTDEENRLAEKINAIGEKLTPELKQDDNARFLALLGEAIMLAHKLFSGKTQMAVISDLLIRAAKNYKPEGGKLYNYLARNMHFLVWNRIMQENLQKCGLVMRRRKNAAEGKTEYVFIPIVSIDSSGEDDGNDAPPELPGNDPPIFVQVDKYSLHFQLIALMLSISRKMKPERAPGEKLKGIDYYQMFYTSGMTDFLLEGWEQDLKAMEAHERDLFESMRLKYLDYYMDGTFRQVRKLAGGKMKPRSELVLPKPKDTEAYLSERPVTVEDRVLYGYLGKVENASPSKSVLSNHKAAYAQLVKEETEADTTRRIRRRGVEQIT